MQDEERAARDAERRREDQDEKGLQVKEVAALDPLHGNQASGKHVEIVDVGPAAVGGVGGEGAELEQPKRTPPSPAWFEHEHDGHQKKSL